MCNNKIDIDLDVLYIAHNETQWEQYKILRCPIFFFFEKPKMKNFN